MSPRPFVVALLTTTLAAPLATSAAAQSSVKPAKSYDINGDGYRDLLVGAPGDSRGIGTVHVALGSKTGFDAGEQINRRTEVLVSADFDGDGFADVASSDISGREVLVDYGAARHPGNARQAQVLTARRQRSDADVSGQVTDDSGFGFGWSLTAGDFNHDGYADLAIGHPYADVPATDVATGPGTGAAGVVLVHYGSAEGIDHSTKLAPGKYEEWNEVDGNVEGGAGSGDHFGYAVTTGDVNGDGTDDLIVGIPGKSSGDITGAGAVTELFGTTSGLTATGNATFSLATPGVNGEPTQQKDCDEDDGCNPEGENFGAALAAGDIDDDGYADVAIGTPDKAVVAGAHSKVGNPGHDGSLSVLFGAPTGMTARSQYITFNTPGVPGTVPAEGAHFARFASQIVMADFNGNGHADVAAADEKGRVLVFGGGAHRLRTIDVHKLTGAPYTKDGRVIAGLGGSLLAVDLDNDDRADLVAGAPGAFVAGASGAGAIVVFGGGKGGLVQQRAQLMTERRPFGGSNSEDNQFGWVGSQNVFITGD